MCPHQIPRRWHLAITVHSHRSAGAALLETLAHQHPKGRDSFHTVRSQHNELSTIRTCRMTKTQARHRDFERFHIRARIVCSAVHSKFLLCLILYILNVLFLRLWLNIRPPPPSNIWVPGRGNAGSVSLSTIR
jgi:hypothetical protein